MKNDDGLYTTKNPKFYLVVTSDDGEDINELIFTRKAILDYLREHETNTEPTT